MNLRVMRERKLLSQERLAEMSGLSLRTIQRAEAGHRVSYASLRSLAATLEIEVDLLERELYAVKTPINEDFVEIPRWVRIMDDTRWFGGPGLSRREVLILEAFCAVAAVAALGLSFLMDSGARAGAVRVCSFVALACAYQVARYIRLSDKYRLWAGAGSAESPPVRRTWRSRVAEYAYLFGVGIVGTVVICWLASRFGAGG